MREEEEEKEKLSVRLQVAAAKGQDQGKGVARLNVESLRELGLQGGEIIEITGKRTTAAIALPPYDDDAGIDMIRLAGLERVAAVGRDRIAYGEKRKDGKTWKEAMLEETDLALRRPAADAQVQDFHLRIRADS